MEENKMMSEMLDKLGYIKADEITQFLNLMINSVHNAKSELESLSEGKIAEINNIVKYIELKLEENKNLKSEIKLEDKKLTENITRLSELMKEVKNGINGIDGIDGKDGENGKDGKDGKDGENGSPDTPEQLAEKINTLEEKIEMKTIKGLRKTLIETSRQQFIQSGNNTILPKDIPANSIDFITNPTAVPTAPGTLSWNDEYGTLDLKLKGGNTTLQIGQEQIIRVLNKTGSDLLEANYPVVRFNGSQGQRPKVDLAQANSEITSTVTIGVVTEDIHNNNEGFITVQGLVSGINTTGTLQGEVWEDGDVLWLSDTVAGGITKNKPVSPSHLVLIGYVIYAHQTQGKIYVHIQNGYELGELHDVKITNPANSDLLRYNDTLGIWENKAIGIASGVQAYNANTTILGNTTTGTGSIVLATAPQISQIELGHATDTTLSRSSAGVLSVEGVVVPTISSTNTLTNKRITKRVLALSAGSATPAINTNNYDVVHITAQSAAITSFTMTGTPVDGDTLRISITDNGTARAIAWGTSFEASTVALPTTTVASTRLDVVFFWNTETNKWRCVATA